MSLPDRSTADRSAPAAPLATCRAKGCDNSGILVAGWCEPHYLRRHRVVRHRRPVVLRSVPPAVYLMPRIRG